MKTEQNFAMGHSFSSQEIFHNFPIKKLQMTYDDVKEIYSDGDKRSLSASIFNKGMELIINDIIENNEESNYERRARTFFTRKSYRI